MTDTTRSWAKLSQPSANAAGTLISAANRVRSMATITGRLRRNSTHGPSGTATTAPAASPAAASTDTSAGPACSARIAISENASNASHVPTVLTAYAAHSQPNCRPSDRLVTMFQHPSRSGPNNFRLTRTIKASQLLRSKQPTGRRATTESCATRVGGVDLDAVRTFVAVADAGQFSEAAVDLSITQQAVSKRVAALEKDLGVRLFTRTARGGELTVDGQAFLPHARDLLRAEERAAAAVQPGRRALRVDVINRRIAPTALLRDFHRAHPETEIDVVTLFDADTAIAAVRSGAIDATFRAVTVPARQLPAASRPPGSSTSPTSC